jgi:hypothetical protein
MVDYRSRWRNKPHLDHHILLKANLNKCKRRKQKYNQAQLSVMDARPSIDLWKPADMYKTKLPQPLFLQSKHTKHHLHD